MKDKKSLSGENLNDKALLTELRESGYDAVVERFLFNQFSLEVAADEVFWLQSDSKVIYINQFACERLGYTRDELLSMYIWELDPNLTEAIWKEFWIGFKERKFTQSETLHKAKSGEIIPVEMKAYLYSAGEQDFLVGFATDISAKKFNEAKVNRHQSYLEMQIESRTKNLVAEKNRAEQKAEELRVALSNLAKSEQMLSQTGEVAGVGGWELDLLTNDLSWTVQTYRIHKLPENTKVTVELAIEFYAPEAKSAIQSAIERTIETGIGWDLELPVNRADGVRIWVRVAGEIEYNNNLPVRLFGTFHDITDARRTRIELAEKNELLQVTLKSIGDGVITTDANCNVTWLNPAAEQITGWSNKTANGKPLNVILELLNAVSETSAQRIVNRCVKNGELVEFADDSNLLSKSGREYAVEGSASPIKNDSNDILGAVLIFSDVTESRRISSEINYRASHDVLTGLLNRAEFEISLGKALDSVHRERSSQALLFIDLDQFKIVNDTCGHNVGDTFLVQVAKLLLTCVRPRDLVARLGGDEFAIILKNCSSEKAAMIAQNICEEIESYRFLYEQSRFRIGASIGLVPIDQRWIDTESIMKAVDNACYAAKDAGRNRVHLWVDTDELIKARRQDLIWATRLEKAFDENRFVLFAQRIFPIGRQSNGLHAEILIRMVDEHGKIVPAGVFFPAAERFNFATRLDKWVLQSTLAELNKLDNLDSIEMIAVNISGQSIGDRTFHQFVREQLSKVRIELRERLCLEITETEAIRNITDAKDFIQQAREVSVKVALDDFGAGASSFSYIKHLPVDLLKIDGQFVQDIIHDPLDEVAVRSFVDVARVRGVQTIAEFVDQPEVLERLRELEVDFAQGYLLHKPEPLALVLKNHLFELSD